MVIALIDRVSKELAILLCKAIHFCSTEYFEILELYFVHCSWIMLIPLDLSMMFIITAGSTISF